MAEEKNNHFGLLLVGIVGIVAIVGLIILFSGKGATTSNTGSSTANSGGNAFRTPVDPDAYAACFSDCVVTVCEPAGYGSGYSECSSNCQKFCARTSQV